MKTQVSIFVEGGSLTDKIVDFGNRGIRSFFSPAEPPAVEIRIDDKAAIKLEARTEPYLIDVEPGQHRIQFTDSAKAGKGMLKEVFRLSLAICSGILSLVWGGSAGGFSDVMAVTGGKKVEDNVASLVLKEGDLVKLSCKPTSGGKVKVKIL